MYKLNPNNLIKLGQPTEKCKLSRINITHVQKEDKEKQLKNNKCSWFNTMHITEETQRYINIYLKLALNTKETG